jgi:hypothetical protein
VVTPIVFGLIQRLEDGLANTVAVVQGLVTTAGILVAGV